MSFISRAFSSLYKHNIPRSVTLRRAARLSSAAAAPAAEKLHQPTLEGQEKEFPTHIVKIVDDIAKLTLLEVADLNELLSKRLNIKVRMTASEYFNIFSNRRIGCINR